MPKYKAYIYPRSQRISRNIFNPYLKEFIKASQNHFDIVNEYNRSNIGFLGIVKYIFSIKILFLNWIEELPEKKGGVIQTLAFFVFLCFLKLRSCKIVWTLHNKLTHYNNKLFLKRLIFYFLIRNANVILTHSEEGLVFLNEKYPDSLKRAYCFQHPVKLQMVNLDKTEKLYDAVIWGTIAPYKGIESFLKFIQQKNKAVKILVVGKIKNPKYKSIIETYASDNIRIIDKYLDFKELEIYLNQAKNILFTYQSDSVLSSGALMDSLGIHVPIIGPNKGAFADLAEMGMIETFSSYEDILYILQSNLNMEEKIAKRTRFIMHNTWENYLDFIADKIYH